MKLHKTMMAAVLALAMSFAAGTALAAMGGGGGHGGGGGWGGGSGGGGNWGGGSGGSWNGGGHGGSWGGSGSGSWNNGWHGGGWNNGWHGGGWNNGWHGASWNRGWGWGWRGPAFGWGWGWGWWGVPGFSVSFGIPWWGWGWGGVPVVVGAGPGFTSSSVTYSDQSQSTFGVPQQGMMMPPEGSSGAPGPAQNYVPPPQYRYFCPDGGFYPDVRSCPQGWMPIPPGASPPAPAANSF
jgi:hypothetical protein